ncbi:MAG: hypothetical protein M3Q03_20770 [Chloroflexota bacterium]|nr:hypothetical protein [Chloroflexota bacterium]
MGQRLLGQMAALRISGWLEEVATALTREDPERPCGVWRSAEGRDFTVAAPAMV